MTPPEARSIAAFLLGEMAREASTTVRVFDAVPEGGLHATRPDAEFQDRDWAPAAYHVGRRMATYFNRQWAFCAAAG